MSIIGNPIVSTDFPKDTFSGNGSTTAFTMSVAPASVNAVVVVVSGVVQDPSTYTVSGTTLTFSAAPPSGTSNISIRHLGVAGSPNVPALGSVVPASINSSYSLWNLSGSDVNYTAGKVGIGTTSPQKKLSVSNGGAVGLDIDPIGRSGEAATSLLSYNRSTSAYVPAQYDASQHEFLTSNTERMRIDNAGSVAIGTSSTASATRLTVYGSGTGSNTLATYKNSAGTTLVSLAENATSWASGSDPRLKNITGSYSSALNDIAQIKPIKFTWKNDSTNAPQVGVDATTVESVVPEAISKAKLIDGDDTEYLTVKYQELVPLMIAAIQELNAKVDAQALEIQALKGTV